MSVASKCISGYILTQRAKYGLGSHGAGSSCIGTGTCGRGKLPAEGTQARRFGKTRSAQSTALLEDYAELIADLLASEGEARPTDIARRLGVSHATAIKTISRLKRAGSPPPAPIAAFSSPTKATPSLTGSACATGSSSTCCARSACRPNSAEADAEGIEHHVSETTLKAFAQFLKSRE